MEKTTTAEGDVQRKLIKILRWTPGLAGDYSSIGIDILVICVSTIILVILASLGFKRILS